MANGKGLAIAGLVVVAFIVVAYVIVPGGRFPGVQMPNSINLEWSVYGMKDGARVTPPLAFIAQGVEIDALGASCSWDAQGDSVDWDTLVIAGRFTIYLMSYRGEKTDITSENLSFGGTGVAQKSGTTSFEDSLTDLILGRPYTYGDSEGQYWDVRIELHVTGAVQQAVGSDWIEDAIDDYIDYRIYWEDGTFELTGGITR